MCPAAGIFAKGTASLRGKFPSTLPERRILGKVPEFEWATFENSQKLALDKLFCLCYTRLQVGREALNHESDGLVIKGFAAFTSEFFNLR